MTMRVLIVDDEPIARRGLRQLLAAHDDIEVVGEARNGKEAIRALKTLAPDLVLLDVQMPECDGFEVLRRLEQRLPAVIFVTAYDSYAVRAFETHALDYLVKPVHEKRFHAAIERARDRMRSEEAVELSQRLAHVLATLGVNAIEESRTPPRRLIIPGTSADVVVDITDIVWIEADDYYAAIHAHGRRHLVRESLDSLEARLDSTRFVRIHRSAIVSLAHVREIRTRNGRAFVTLNDGTRVPLSRRRREAVTGALRRFAG